MTTSIGRKSPWLAASNPFGHVRAAVSASAPSQPHTPSPHPAHTPEQSHFTHLIGNTKQRAAPRRDCISAQHPVTLAHRKPGSLCRCARSRVAPILGAARPHISPRVPRKRGTEGLSARAPPKPMRR
jgi:hypothetical protein